MSLLEPKGGPLLQLHSKAHLYSDPQHRHKALGSFVFVAFQGSKGLSEGVSDMKVHVV